MTKPSVNPAGQPKAYLLRDIAFYWTQDCVVGLIGPLHQIFCGGHNLLDDDRYDYAMHSSDEFLNALFAVINGLSQRKKVDLRRHLQWYLDNENELHDEGVYKNIFHALQERNISFEYKYPCSDSKREELLKAERLVTMMIGYRDHHALSEGRIEEYFELARLDLEEIQHVIQDRLLLNTFNELAPCKMLSAYFTTHLRLPETTGI